MKGDVKNPKRVGLTLGIVNAIFHLVWIISVGTGIGQVLINWITPLHFINNMYSITSFNILNAIWLVILAFVGGFIFGWVIAEVWNLVVKKIK